MRHPPHTVTMPATVLKMPARRRKSCYAIARRRAVRTHREGRHGLIVFLVFLWALFSAPFVRLPVAALPRPNPLRPTRPPRPRYDASAALPHGHGVDAPTLRPSYAFKGRYRTRPGLAKLIADLRRRAARKDAAAELLPRVADPVARAWAAERIVEDDITALAAHVRRGHPEEITFAAWRTQADAAKRSEPTDTPDIAINSGIRPPRP